MSRYILPLILVTGCISSPPEVAPVSLTPTEYNNTVRDLLGMPEQADQWPDTPAIAEQLVPSQGQQAGLFGSAPVEVPPWPWEFPEEEGINDFDGMADGQLSTPYLVEELQKAAVFYGAHTLVSPTFFQCDFAGQPADIQEACGWASVERFAQRAWRRPVTDEERVRLRGLWESQWAQGTPEEAVVLVSVAILQAPAFVFRVEGTSVERMEGDVIRLNDWEMASRLSYFLWDSMPDGALFEAASRGALRTRAGIKKEARRMLADPKARPALVRFHDHLLGTKRTLTVSPARRAYGPLFGISESPPLDTTGDGVWPSLLGPIRHSMVGETTLFIERTVFDGQGTFSALMTDHHGYMSDRTAPIYGEQVVRLNGPSVSWAYGNVVFSQGATSTLELYPVRFDPQERAGILTLPSVLALGAYPVHPAPVQRGLRILERLACQNLGAPPPEAEAGAPPDIPEAESTNRARTEAATSPENCAVCHTTINPPGFAYEHYDSMGRYRTMDNGSAVDASGTLQLIGGETFTFEDGVGLAHQLSQSTQVRSCYAKHWVDYAVGAEVSDEDPELIRLQEKFVTNDHIPELLVSIVSSDLFRFRRVGGAQ